jgi:hypothetical protein
MIGSVSSGFRRRRPRNATKAATAATPSPAGSRQPRPDDRAAVCEISALGSSNGRLAICGPRPDRWSGASWLATGRRCDCCTLCADAHGVASTDVTGEASARIVRASPRPIMGSTGVVAPTGSLGDFLSTRGSTTSLLGALATADAAAAASGAAWTVSEAEPATAFATGAAAGTGLTAAGSASTSVAGGASDAIRGGSKVKGSM